LPELSKGSAVEGARPDGFEPCDVYLAGTITGAGQPLNPVSPSSISAFTVCRAACIGEQPNPAEGKTTTVVNLAVVIAQAGKKVLIVDADLRRPYVHRFFGLDNTRGLSDALLQSDPNPAEFVQNTPIEHLHVSICSLTSAGAGH
jgi:hypothetical protein